MGLICRAMFSGQIPVCAVAVRHSTEMTVRAPIYVFKHVGTDSDADQRKRQAILGCAPAQVLFERVVAVDLAPEVKEEGREPRSFSDYCVTVDRDSVPNGVELLELPRDMDKL